MKGKIEKTDYPFHADCQCEIYFLLYHAWAPILSNFKYGSWAFCLLKNIIVP